MTQKDNLDDYDFVPELKKNKNKQRKTEKEFRGLLDGSDDENDDDDVDNSNFGVGLVLKTLYFLFLGRHRTFQVKRGTWKEEKSTRGRGTQADSKRKSICLLFTFLSDVGQNEIVLSTGNSKEEKKEGRSGRDRG